MKRLFILLVLFSAARLVTAQVAESRVPPAGQQSPAVNQAARLATDALTEKYGLDAGQQAGMYTVQERKQRNLAEIEALQTADPERYRIKLQSVQKGTLNSIDRLLSTPEQKQLFRKTQMDVRTQRAEKRRELQRSGVPAQEIERQLLLLYTE
jgi:hypothetical protein